MALNLTGKQLKRFSSALLRAFPDYGDLERMVRFEMDERLKEIVSEKALTDVTFALVTWADTTSRVDELLRAALTQNPTNETLKRFAQEVMLTSGAPPDAALAKRFEAEFLKGVKFQNVVTWRRRMEAMERCVCRIAGDNTLGTGFLVGPGVVMTNAHVTELLDSARLEFDYKLGDSEKTVALRSVSVEAMSPKEKLDYALLRLPAGDPVTAERGYVERSEAPIRERTPLFVLQHPEGDLLKICVGSAVHGLEPDRVYYEANTLPGSSGSPVFDIGWQLVALHHASAETANEGIPMQAIMNDVRKKGQDKLFGA